MEKRFCILLFALWLCQVSRHLHDTSDNNTGYLVSISVFAKPNVFVWYNRKYCNNWGESSAMRLLWT